LLGVENCSDRFQCSMKHLWEILTYLWCWANKMHTYL
jgi:hypothetical protein